MKRLVHIIETISNTISGDFSGLLIFLMMSMVMIEVITRYALRFPLTVADEMGGYLLVAVAFTGLAFTWKERSHIRIEFIVNKLPEQVKKWLRLLTIIIAIAFIAVLIKANFELVAYSFDFHTRSSGLRVPLAWPQMVMLIGTAILLLHLIAELVGTVRTLRIPGGKAQ